MTTTYINDNKTLSTKANAGPGGSNGKSASTRATNSPGGSTGVSPACAVCKYQRRRCAPDCLLAPYFPADHQKDFLNVHRLFGVSNVTKILKSVKPCERETAMKSMIYQANVRASDPVGGCYGIIDRLQQEIDRDRAELHLVLRQLAIYRSQSVKDELQNLRIPAAVDGNGLVVYDPVHARGVQPIRFKGQGFVSPDSDDQFKGKAFVSQDSNNMCFRDQMESLHNLPCLPDESSDSLGIYDERQPVMFESKKSIRCSDKAVSSSHAKQVNERKIVDPSFSLDKT